LSATKRNIYNHEKRNVRSIVCANTSEFSTRRSPSIKWPTNISYFPPDTFIIPVRLIILGSGVVAMLSVLPTFRGSSHLYVEGDMTVH